MAQIALFNVTNDTQYFPQRRDIFNESRWKEAKRLLAQALKLTSKEAGRYSSRFLQDRMVVGTSPYLQEAITTASHVLPTAASIANSEASSRCTIL